jgi:hypothetical protein
MKTKYYKTWPEYMAKHPDMMEEEAKVAPPRIQMYEEQMFGFIMFLCF